MTPMENFMEKGAALHLRVDGNTQQIYAPGGGAASCVAVVSWEDNRLGSVETQRILACVRVCRSVGVLAPDTLCACDWSSVKVVNVTNDTVTATLRKPVEVADKRPVATAVLGCSILVQYDADANFVVYENGVSSPGITVAWPVKLQNVSGISSDGVSRFLVCDDWSKAVFTFDVSGDTTSKVLDCTVGDGKLCVGCSNGDIIVM